MASVKKYPFYTETETKIALMTLRERSISYYVIADIILHTGAELSDVLAITCQQLSEGQTFMADDNPNRSVSLRQYKSLLKRNNFILEKRAGEGLAREKKAGDSFLFTDPKGVRLKESNIRSAISRLSASTGVDVSLIRFQKTFLLDYMIKKGSRWALKEVASSGRVNEFCNEEWIKDYLGLTDKLFRGIQAGTLEPIIDQNTQYTAESLKDACSRLEKVLKDVKKQAETINPLYAEHQELIIEDSIRRLQSAAGFPRGNIRVRR